MEGWPGRSANLHHRQERDVRLRNRASNTFIAQKRRIAALRRPYTDVEGMDAALARPEVIARRIQQVLGKSPLSYFQDLRVERAVHLLRTTNQSVDEIASRVGYSDGVTLRTLLRRRLGQGIKE